MEPIIGVGLRIDRVILRKAQAEYQALRKAEDTELSRLLHSPGTALFSTLLYPARTESKETRGDPCRGHKVVAIVGRCRSSSSFPHRRRSNRRRCPEAALVYAGRSPRPTMRRTCVITRPPLAFAASVRCEPDGDSGSSSKDRLPNSSALLARDDCNIDRPGWIEEAFLTV